MTSRTALMFALAIMLIVANVMEKEGQVSKIAAKDASELRENVEEVGSMEGFSSEESLMLELPDEEERNEERQQQAAMSADGAPEIGDFSWDGEEKADTRQTSRRAKIEAPEHHRLAEGEETTDFNPTIRKR